MKNFLVFGTPLSGAGNSLVLLLLRVAISALMLTHGIDKLQHFTELQASFPNPVGLGSTVSLTLVIMAEAGCSLLLVAGLLSRLAALVLMFNMFVAAFVFHSGDALAGRELAIVYFVVYVALFFSGAGRYSLDYLFFNSCKDRP